MSHSVKKLNHNQNRMKVCAVCFDKVKNGRKLTFTEEQILSAKIYGYRTVSGSFPSTLCCSCRILIVKHGANFDKHIKIFDYSSNNVRYAKGDADCFCLICKVAKYNINQTNKFCTKKVIKKQHKKTDMRCENCLNVLGRGKRHHCNRSERIRHMKNIAESEGRRVCSQESYQITSDDMIRIKNRLNASQNQIKILSQELRKCNKNYDRKIVQSNVHEQINENSHKLDEFFDIIVETGITYVYCVDIEKFLRFVLKERKSNDIHVKIGMDSGGGTFKITLNLVETIDSMNVPSTSKQHKLSGVKRLFIIGLCSNTTENYQNVLKMWQMIRLNKLFSIFSCTIQADLKIIMISCGLMSCSSKCPCPYCDTSDLNRLGDIRTVKSVIDNHNLWQTSGAKKKSDITLKYKCCINNPIFDVENEETNLIEICSPPELHLMIGVVNRVYAELKKYHPEASSTFVNDLGISRTSQFGFNGKESRAIIKNAARLQSILDTGCRSKNKFVAVFEALNRVVHCCFGNELGEKFEKDIEIFANSWDKLGIKHTVKSHIIIHHIPSFCKSSQAPLGFYSEQTSESVHYDFKNHWNRYKVDPANKLFHSKLLRAVCSYNASHL